MPFMQSISSSVRINPDHGWFGYKFSSTSFPFHTVAANSMSLCRLVSGRLLSTSGVASPGIDNLSHDVTWLLDSCWVKCWLPSGVKKSDASGGLGHFSRRESGRGSWSFPTSCNLTFASSSENLWQSESEVWTCKRANFQNLRYWISHCLKLHPSLERKVKSMPFEILLSRLSSPLARSCTSFNTRPIN